MGTLDLKPCPFCGGEAKLVNTMFAGDMYKTVFCLACNANTNNFNARDEKSAMRAVDAWNRRANDESNDRNP